MAREAQGQIQSKGSTKSGVGSRCEYTAETVAYVKVWAFRPDCPCSNLRSPTYLRAVYF